MLIQEYKSETTILFNESKVMLHVVHIVPGTGGTGTNLRVCEDTQNNWQKEQQQEQFIDTRIANCKNQKLYRIVLLTHNYLQKGKFWDLVNNNVHKGNCIVQASSAEKLA